MALECERAAERPAAAAVVRHGARSRPCSTGGLGGRSLAASLPCGTQDARTSHTKQLQTASLVLVLVQVDAALLQHGIRCIRIAAEVVKVAL